MQYRLGSVFWLLVGIYTLIQAHRLGLGHFNYPGPGFIFFWAALFLIVLSVIDLALISTEKQKRYPYEKDTPLWTGQRWQTVLLVLLVLSTYVYFLDDLGFWISTFLLMVFLYKGVGSTRWWISVVGALITLSISYAIFKVWLLVEFPKGFTGI